MLPLDTTCIGWHIKQVGRVSMLCWKYWIVKSVFKTLN